MPGRRTARRPPAAAAGTVRRWPARSSPGRASGDGACVLSAFALRLRLRREVAAVAGAVVGEELAHQRDVQRLVVGRLHADRVVELAVVENRGVGGAAVGARRGGARLADAHGEVHRARHRLQAVLDERGEMADVAGVAVGQAGHGTQLVARRAAADTGRARAVAHRVAQLHLVGHHDGGDDDAQDEQEQQWRDEGELDDGDSAIARAQACRLPGTAGCPRAVSPGRSAWGEERHGPCVTVGRAMSAANRPRGTAILRPATPSPPFRHALCDASSARHRDAFYGAGRSAPGSSSHSAATTRTPAAYWSRSKRSLGAWIWSSGRPTPTSTLGSPSTLWKVATGGMVPPVRMIAGSAPKPWRIARRAACTAGWSIGVTTGRPPFSTCTSTRTAGGAALRRASATSAAISSGSWSGTRRQLILAPACAGMIVLLPGPEYPPQMPLTSRVGRSHIRSSGVQPSSPTVAGAPPASRSSAASS